MKIDLKKSTISLEKLLKRRKSTLKQFVSDNGLTTYSSLVKRCKQIGVSPPAEGDFNVAAGTIVSNPAEGVLVFDPPPVILDNGEREEYNDVPAPDLVTLTGEAPKRRRRKKRDALDNDLESIAEHNTEFSETHSLEYNEDIQTQENDESETSNY